jgi:hypothetical protein
MTTKGIESVLIRAMSDEAFADLLFSNTEAALSGFDLTEDEISKLKSVSRAEFDQLASASPEERKSFLTIRF